MTYQQQIADATTTQLLATTDAALSSGLSSCSLSAETMTVAEAALAFSTTTVPIAIADATIPGFGSSFFFYSAAVTTIPAANY